MNRKATLAVLTPQNATEVVEVGRLGDSYPEPVQVVAFSPDGALLACSTYDELFLWDVRRKRQLVERAMPVQALAFSPDGQTLVVAGRDIIFLDMPSGEQQAVLKGHPRGTTCVAFNNAGDLLASGGMDGLVRIGNIRTKRLAGKMEHAAPVRGVAFSPDGDLLAAISWGLDSDTRQVYVWHVASGEQRATFPCTKEKNVSFSPDGAWLAVDGKVFDLQDRRVVHDFNERQIAFSPDGQLIAACHNNFTTIGLMEAASGEKLNILKGHGDPVWQIAINAEGTLIASGSGSLSAGARLRGEVTDETITGDRSVRLWGVYETPPEEVYRERRPLKRLGGDEEETEDKDDTLLKPVQDFFSKLSRGE